MADDRMRGIPQLFEEAIKRQAKEREGLRAEARGGDIDLRREVESLLRHHMEAPPARR